MGMRAFSSDHERVERLLEEYRSSSPEVKHTSEYVLPFLSNAYHLAGITPEEEQKSLRKVVGGTLIGGLIAFLTSYLLFLLVGPLLAANDYLRIRERIRKRTEAFDKDYTAFLLSLSSSIKTGFDPLTAMIRCGALFRKDSEIRKQLDALKSLIEKGAREEEALFRFGHDIQHPDLPLFRNAMVLARQEGSSLASCLQRLAKVTRQRQSFRRRIKAALAMQRLSSWGIMGCASAVLAGQAWTQPTAIKEAWGDPTGHAILVTGGLLLVSGALLLYRLGNRKF